MNATSILKHQTPNPLHTQAAHRSNFGPGVVVIPEYVSLVGSSLLNPDAPTLDVLIRDESSTPVYWQQSIGVLVRRTLAAAGKPVNFIFDPHGPHAGPYQPIYDLVLRRSGDGGATTGAYRIVKSAARIIAQTESDDMHSDEGHGLIVKAVPEQQYTFTLLYPASDPAHGSILRDAHREYATETELRAGKRRYLALGDRNIYRQHAPTFQRLGRLVQPQALQPIGTWEDIVQWPWEVADVEFRTPQGQITKGTVPANSIWMGVGWNDIGWPLVKAGELRGLSYGGTAARKVNSDGEAFWRQLQRLR